MVFIGKNSPFYYFVGLFSLQEYFNNGNDDIRLLYGKHKGAEERPWTALAPDIVTECNLKKVACQYV